ncbi:hypothetical protein NJ7G_2475 [Natrinema sp. J7-2]|uniref:Uncharacterized protein n=1 Tax=Natrinema gari JCM 14663 TaxID=1230459 RepID=L9Z3H2_9EURY|nr:hypothetical protein NJ7G_2475 [Natrinema sp. J7-2]ELY80914.1 hypothetical protein C486_08375 [Natrinema gari JCM 14663]
MLRGLARLRRPETGLEQSDPVSSVPCGPLPDSVSTRVSTVPTTVRHAKTDVLTRIYARRWKTAARPT